MPQTRRTQRHRNQSRSQTQSHKRTIVRPPDSARPSLSRGAPGKSPFARVGGGRNLLILVGSALVIIAVGTAVWLSTTRTAPPVGSQTASGTTASTTQVSLPDFGQVAADAAADAPPPEIGTPTPGIAGPTAVVVTNSPWQVLVNRGAVAELQAPSGITVDAEGNLYVIDFGANFIQKFSPGGQALERFGQKGTGPGQFSGPMDLAVDSQGNLYVADTNNQRIQKLSPTGQPLAQWGSGGDGAGQFWLPSGVAVDDQGKVYVADRGNHRLQVLSPSGQPIAQWGTRGPAPGQFWSPSDVALDAKGQIYVADSNNQRIQVLSSTGQPIAQWGWEGTDPGLFELPSSIALDPGGNVYVTDTRNARIQKLSPTGQPLAAWGVITGANTPRPAPEPGTFVSPGGVAVDKSGAVYVADTRNQRIQKLTQ